MSNAETQGAEAPPAATPPEAATIPAPASPAASAAATWPSVTIPLTRPLPLPNGGQLTELRLVEPDLEAMERISAVVENLGLMNATEDVKLTIRQIRPILAAFSGIDEAVLARLHFKDIAPISEALVPLLEGLAT